MSDWIDTEGYRANVGILLMRDSGEVFLGQRTGGRGWQFPQGGVRQGEPVEQALYRELHEEIGLTREPVGAAARPVSARNSAGSCCVWRCPRAGWSSISRVPMNRNSTAGAGQTTGN